MLVLICVQVVQANNSESNCKEKGKGKKLNYVDKQIICKLAPQKKQKN
jgi:hypothetical protein